jgi:hypothetical protein
MMQVAEHTRCHALPLRGRPYGQMTRHMLVKRRMDGRAATIFPDRPLALREMKRVLVRSGRLGLSVYSAIERTPAAHAFALALDRRLGPGASSIKRAEHIFSAAEDVDALIAGAGFEQIETRTVTHDIVFPSVLDYVRFQLIATPMAGLLSDRPESEREAAIDGIASDTQSLLGREMIADGRLRFPQEAYVATASRGA